MSTPTLALGVPGLWKNPPALTAGDTGQPFRLELRESAPGLSRAFELAGRGSIAKQVLQQIEVHTMTVRLVTLEAASISLCMSLMKAAAALLEAGGLAVMVETAGVAHAEEDWRSILGLASPEFSALAGLTHRVIVPGESTTYSTGMKHFGLPDADVLGNAPEHAALLDRLGRYQVLGHALRTGETFSVDAGGPAYRLHHGIDRRWERAHLLHNTFGIWHLEALAHQAPGRLGLA